MKKLFGLLLVLFSVACISSVGRATESATEAEATAAFLFNFARYTDWPLAQDKRQYEPLYFCFYRAERAAEVSTTMLTGTLVGDRNVVIRSVRITADLKGCDLVYTRDPSPEWLISPGHGCLTIGRGREFIDSGGIIALVEQGDHLRFIVNRRSAREAGLALSSKLLNLAVEVIDE